MERKIFLLLPMTILAVAVFTVPAFPAQPSRFKLVMRGEAVLDKETELVWEQSPDTGSKSWFSAVNHCFNNNVGGRKGWRPPAVEELTSLLDPTRIDEINTALPVRHPFINVQPDRYWSATTGFSSDPNQAMFVSFKNGEVGNDRKVDGHLVWCVRGGQSRN